MLSSACCGSLFLRSGRDGSPAPERINACWYSGRTVWWCTSMKRSPGGVHFVARSSDMLFPPETALSNENAVPKDRVACRVQHDQPAAACFFISSSLGVKKMNMLATTMVKART